MILTAMLMLILQEFVNMKINKTLVVLWAALDFYLHFRLSSDLDKHVTDGNCNFYYGSRIHCLKYIYEVESVASSVGILSEEFTSFRTTMCEDNMGALTHANIEPGRIIPSSKFCALKYLSFRTQLKKTIYKYWRLIWT